MVLTSRTHQSLHKDAPVSRPLERTHTMAGTKGRKAEASSRARERERHVGDARDALVLNAPVLVLGKH
jgi:hypothetical protein